MVSVGRSFGRAAVLGAVAIVGCGGETSSSSRVDASADAAPFVPTIDAGPCGVTTAFVPPTSANHVEQGSTLAFASNPPCGGDHYPFWASWGIHDTPVPRGNWIHNLEHGGVAFLYRCAERAACPELAAKLEALASSLPQDPLCAAEVPPIANRVIVTPDPALPEGVEVAAAAWGYTLVSRCFDEAAMRGFYGDHFGRATENLCADGASGVSMDAGASTDAAGD